MPVRRTFAFFLFFACAAVPTLLGCTRQQEGERCSLTNGDSDCEEDLVCTEAETLRGGDDAVDRCCPEPDESRSDSRCYLKTTSGLTPGDGDGDGQGGAGGQGGASSGGDPDGLGESCDWNSDCDTALICGPGGVCQYACNQDRDCRDGETCSADQTCVSAN